MLYLVATPIGNLADISFRALKTIESCDYLLCEDTRHSQKLLAHYELRKPLKSYHHFNEASRESQVIADLKEGKTIGLLSDAGTPGISDPGMRLVKRCWQEQLPVSTIPGACALIAALTSSGLSTERFQFIGFLPVKKGPRQRLLQECFLYPGTTIAYESPHRILSTLEILKTIAPTQRIAIARELTKKFEEVQQGTCLELFEKLHLRKPKGEFVLLLESNRDCERIK